MAKKDIDWANIDFDYVKTDYRYVSNFVDGKWSDGELTTDDKVVLSEGAGILQYCQQVFEGLKAYTTKNGDIVTFRPDLNAKRLCDSAERLEMPPFPEEKFLEAVDKLVKANAEWVPPFGSGATLYIRPYIFATSSLMGIKPAKEYQFRMICMPVGPYFKGGVKLLNLCVTDFDRAAANGTGHIKAGLNYAMSLHANVTAHKNGYDENMYLDTATRTYVEEAGGANFLFVTKDGEIVTPQSESILPSITRRSLLYLANDLGFKVTERKVKVSELGDFVECGLCGTAAVISPVGTIDNHGEIIKFENSKGEMGPVLKKLYDTITGMQIGNIEAPEGWIRKIM